MQLLDGLTTAQCPQRRQHEHVRRGSRSGEQTVAGVIRSPSGLNHPTSTLSLPPYHRPDGVSARVTPRPTPNEGSDTVARVKHILGIIRAPFLLLTPACVFLGAAAAVYECGDIDAASTALILVGALAAHVGVNALNEYSDFRSGLDASTERTPFSGGSGTLPEQPGLARTALAIGLGACALTAAIGLYFVLTIGLAVLVIGVLGPCVILTYTVWVTRSPVLCLVAPGFGFGSLMAMGTHLVLSGHVSQASVLTSLVPFFLVNNLLLLNQFPDTGADRAVGRRHLPIVLGRRRGSWVYAVFLPAAYGCVARGPGRPPTHSTAGADTGCAWRPHVRGRIQTLPTTRGG